MFCASPMPHLPPLIVRLPICWALPSTWRYEKLIFAFDRVNHHHHHHYFQVASVKLVKGDGGQNRGYGQVEFKTREDLIGALNAESLVCGHSKWVWIGEYPQINTKWLLQKMNNRDIKLQLPEAGKFITTLQLDLLDNSVCRYSMCISVLPSNICRRS